MSFKIGKSLVCSFCHRQTLTSEENFPDDLHDILTRYNVPQLHWICTACEKEKLPSRQNTRLEDEVKVLKSKVFKLDSDVAFVKETEIKELRNLFEDLNSTVILLKQRVEDSMVIRRNNSYESSEFKSSEDASGVDCVDEKRVTKTPTKWDLSETPSKKNKEALTILHSILKSEIKIDENQAAKSAKIVDSFIMDTLIPALSSDSLFACLYKRIYYTGSSYNDLRISEATEYDINIILDVPKQISLMPEFYQDITTFSKIKWSIVDEVPASKCQVVKFLNKVSESGFLDPLKFTSWFQSLVDKFCLSNPTICDVTKIRSFQSGPARTVELTTVYGYSICIDVVPVFDFSFSLLKGKPVFNILDKYPVEKSKEFWFLVPKLCRGEQVMLAHETKFSWRMHMPEVERAILHNKQCAKPIIKLLKLLRDKLNWKSRLSSYYCATVILWELDKNQDIEHWSGKYLFQRLMEAMESLVSYFIQKKLPYFFNPEHNLFHNLNESLCSNTGNQLNRIITSVLADATSLKHHFSKSV